MRRVIERRTERSAKLDLALRLLLRTQRQRGELDLIGLANQDGLLVAWDGPIDLCEELAAYAPLMARGRHFSLPPHRLRGVVVHSFYVGKHEMLLILRGKTNPEILSTLALASMQGTVRILQG